MERLQSSEDKLIDDDKEFLNPKTVLESFKTVDMFYDIYKYKKTDLNYIKKGIKFIKAVIKPKFYC